MNICLAGWNENTLACFNALISHRFNVCKVLVPFDFDFEQLVSQVDALNGIVDSFLMSQMELNSFITSHFHISPFFGIPNVPSPVIVPSGISTAVRQLVQTKASLVTHKANLVTYKLNYFNPAGNSYINSRYNHTN